MPVSEREVAKELGDKISGDKESGSMMIAAVRDAINRNDVDAMKRTYDDLRETVQKSAPSFTSNLSAGHPGLGHTRRGKRAQKAEEIPQGRRRRRRC